MDRELIVAQEGNIVEISDYLTRILPGDGLVLDMGGNLPANIFENHTNLADSLILNSEVAIKIDKISCQIAQTWYGSEEQHKYKGVFIGDMIAYEVMQLMVSVIKHSIIFDQIFKDNKPQTLVIVDDHKSLTQIIVCIAKSYGIPIRPLTSVSSTKSTKTHKLKFYHFIRESITNIFETYHIGRNVLLKLRKTFSPGFRMARGIECVLFDPYHGYERLVPKIIGKSCKKIIIPRQSFRTMHSSRHYQKIFNTSTTHFRIKNIKPKEEDIIKQWQTLLPQWDNLNAPNSFSNLEGVWSKLILSLHEQIKLLIGKACSDVCSAEAIINKFNVEATILPYDEFGIYKALVLIGKKNNILTIEYQHGVLCKYPAMIPPTSEKVIAWDKDSLQCLISRKVPKFKIEVLTNPIIPYLRNRTKEIDKNLIRKKLGLDSTQSIAFFVAQPFVGISAMDNPAEVHETILKILELSCRLPGFFFLIKLHSNDALSGKFEQISEIIEIRRLSNIKIVFSMSSHELIIASDVVIAETSTALWEATVMNIPAIAFLDREFVKQVSPYNSNPKVIKATNFDALINFLKNKSNIEPSLLKEKYNDLNIETSGYFDNHRWDLFSLVPPNAKSILDVGCGIGWLGKQIKLSRTCKVTGIEINTIAGKTASKVLDKVIINDIEQFPFPFTEKSMDCIILGDLLEHLNDPWSTLHRLVDFLHDKGLVIISIPNIGHYTTLLSLFAGKFEYTNEGILDKTHLRFFTLEGINDLLNKAGLEKVRILRNTSAGRIFRTFNILSGNRLSNLITFQYIIVAKRIE